MIEFFHLPSSCSAAVKAALFMTGEKHVTTSVDLSSKPESFMKANPLGKVPAILDGGHPVSEGGAINLWLSARNPDVALMPALETHEGADALKWLFFSYATIHPVWVRLFYPERFASETASTSVVEMAVTDLFSHYGLIEKQLEKHAFVAGETLTLADLYLVSTIHWEAKFDEKITERYPAIAEYRDRVIALSGVREAFAGEFGYANAA